MVQRTDIAGNVRCSMGQVSPGDSGLCRHAPNGALIETSHLSEPLTVAHFGGNNNRRLFMTAVGPSDLCGDPPDEALTPEHCRGRDDNSARQTNQQREDYKWLFVHDISAAAPRWRWLPY
jgi:hypothetical protein